MFWAAISAELAHHWLTVGGPTAAIVVVAIRAISRHLDVWLLFRGALRLRDPGVPITVRGRGWSIHIGPAGDERLTPPRLSVVAANGSAERSGDAIAAPPLAVAGRGKEIRESDRSTDRPP